eukprot:scaffold286749_cov33-Tisochrysis_lutea.AAC.3
MGAVAGSPSSGSKGCSTAITEYKANEPNVRPSQKARHPPPLAIGALRSDPQKHEATPSTSRSHPRCIGPAARTGVPSG